MYYISWPGYESLQCLEHFYTPVFQLLLLLPPLSSLSWHTLRQSDNVISRKSEILLVSDVCISHSILLQHPPFSSPSPPIPHLTFGGRLFKRGKKKMKCFVALASWSVRKREKVRKKSMSLADLSPCIRKSRRGGRGQRGGGVIGRCACVSEVNGSCEG